MEPRENTWFEGGLKITYDTEADAAYIYLMPEESGNDAILEQISVEDGPEGSEIILDVENSRILHGIEIIGASECLPAILIEQLLKSPGNQEE